MDHDKGFPQPQFSQPELGEPQDEGAQATYDPEDAIVFENAFETGLGEVKGEEEMKSTATDRGSQRGPHLKRRKPPSKRYLHSTGTKTQASMYGAPYIALGTPIASGNTHLQAATGHEALRVLNSRVRRERGTKKSAHTGMKAGSKVLRWPRI